VVEAVEVPEPTTVARSVPSGAKMCLVVVAVSELEATLFVPRRLDRLVERMAV
jgi:hypothetical protein